MSRLYSVTDEEFTAWLESDPTEDELRETYLVLEAKKAALWNPDKNDSYFRDRYERDSDYMKRLLRVKEALMRTWLSTGQVPQTLELFIDQKRCDFGCESCMMIEVS